MNESSPGFHYPAKVHMQSDARSLLSFVLQDCLTLVDLFEDMETVLDAGGDIDSTDIVRLCRSLGEQRDFLFDVIQVTKTLDPTP